MEKMEKKLVNLKKLWEKKKVLFQKSMFELTVFSWFMTFLIVVTLSPLCVKCLECPWGLPTLS